MLLIFCQVGNIMYRVGFCHDDDPIQWAQSQLDDIRAKRSDVAQFMNYMGAKNGGRRLSCGVLQPGISVMQDIIQMLE